MLGTSGMRLMDRDPLQPGAPSEAKWYSHMTFIDIVTSRDLRIMVRLHSVDLWKHQDLHEGITTCEHASAPLIEY